MKCNVALTSAAFLGGRRAAPSAHPRGFLHCQDGDILPSTVGRGGTAGTAASISTIWAVKACEAEGQLRRWAVAPVQRSVVLSLAPAAENLLQSIFCAA